MVGRAGRLALIAHTLTTRYCRKRTLVRTGEGNLEPGGAWLHHDPEQSASAGAQEYRCQPGHWRIRQQDLEREPVARV